MKSCNKCVKTSIYITQTPKNSVLYRWGDSEGIISDGSESDAYVLHKNLYYTNTTKQCFLSIGIIDQVISDGLESYEYVPHTNLHHQHQKNSVLHQREAMKASFQMAQRVMNMYCTPIDMKQTHKNSVLHREAVKELFQMAREVVIMTITFFVTGPFFLATFQVTLYSYPYTCIYVYVYKFISIYMYTYMHSCIFMYAHGHTYCSSHLSGQLI